MGEEIEALKSQVAGLENAYEKLADKCDRLYKVVMIIKKKGVNLHILKMCDNVEEYEVYMDRVADEDDINLLNMCCLTEKELKDYSKGKNFYAIHISQLEIFDKPKELSEFCGTKKYFVGCGNIVDKTPRYAQLHNAPQSWQYIEEVGEFHE